MSNQIEVGIGVKNAGLKKGLAEARESAKHFREELRGEFAGALTIAGLFEAIKGTVEYGDKIDDLSQRFGVGAEALQRWGNVAEENGSSLEGVAASMNKLTIAQDKALAGDDELRSHFAALGVSINDLKTLGPDELMKKIGSSSMNAADLVAVMGKSALELVPTLQAVADGTAEFGSVMDEATIHTLGEASDRIKGIANTLRVGLGTALVWVTDKIADMGAVFGATWAIIEAKMAGKSMKEAIDIGRQGYFQTQAAREEADKPKRRARDQEEKSSAASDKARAAVDELNDLKEKNAARERSDVEQLGVLNDRLIDQQEKVEALKAAGVDAIGEEIDLEKLKAEIATQSKKVEDEEVAVMIKNAEIRERIADLNEQTANIRRDALFDEMDTSQKITELQRQMAENVGKMANDEDERTAELKKQNAELETQIGKLKQVEIAERQAALARRVDDALKSPQQRAQERQAQRTRERVERAVLARDRQRERDRNANFTIGGVPRVPELLKRPSEDVIKQVADKANNKVVEQILTRVEQALGRIEGKVGAGIS